MKHYTKAELTHPSFLKALTCVIWKSVSLELYIKVGTTDAEAMELLR